MSEAYTEDEGPRCTSEIVIGVMGDEPVTVREIMDRIDLGCNEQNTLSKVSKALLKLEKHREVMKYDTVQVKRGHQTSYVKRWLKVKDGEVIPKPGCSFRQPKVRSVLAPHPLYAIDCDCGTTLLGSTPDECKDAWLKHVKGEIE